tara:strand:- start:75 stop:266 length:192 start_codon:yes stop_codon:yes gene_type:complete
VVAGFLESAVEAQYRLGPALMEFEHIMRVTDPLVRAGSTFLEQLIGQLPSLAPRCWRVFMVNG